MKKNIISRLLAPVLALALLLPCLTLAPAKANDNWTIELWKWEAPAKVVESQMQEYIRMFNSNVLNQSGTRSRAFGLRTGSLYTENGPVSMSSFYFRTGTVESNGKYDGMRPVKVGTYMKSAETLHFDLGGIENMYTRGLEALNVKLTVLNSFSDIGAVSAFTRRMEVYVTVDGETWLPGNVGIRSSKLLGAGAFSNTSGYGFYYEIETENLFDIEGFNPGDVLRGIRIYPEGKVADMDSLWMVQNIVVNGYETQKDWETAVPEENRPTITVDPDVLRQIAVDEGVRTATIPWTTDTFIDLTSPLGSSAAATSFHNKQYAPGIQYQGPPYNRVVDGTREQLFASIVDGKFTSGYGNDTAIGMDCQTFGFNFLSRVSRTNACYCSNMLNASGLHVLGNLKVSTNNIPRFTDVHMINLNTEQEVYECYALAKGGDVLDTYQSNASNSLHVRPIRDVIVVRNADGTIDGNKSYMLTVESMGDIVYEVQRADGTIVTLEHNIIDELYADLEANYPGAKILYGHSARSAQKHTFASLYSGKYVAFSPDVYQDGVVELADVEMVFGSMKTGKPVEEGGLYLAVASNYRIIDRTIKLEDLSTGEVLYEHFEMPEAKPNSVHMAFYDNNLNNLMANLTNGSYRLSATITSGPLTAIGQTKVPETTKTYDFTITDKQPAASVSLSTPNSVSKGDSVQILVNSTGAFDAADVEVKVDSELLTFANGTLTPANAFGQVTANKGMVSIMAVDAGVTSAGQLAVLNFTAKSDIANVGKVVQLKSAQLVSADSANGGNAVKAMDATEVCASINFADVAKNAWYHEAVDYAVSNGIMGGYNATTFGPNDKLSRAMVVQVLFNNEGQPTIAGSHKFPDVKAGDWFNNAVTWANINKVVGGYGDGRFGPNDNVTLEQIAVILWNYSGNPTPTGNAAALGAHSDWAANALSWAQASGIFKNVPYDTVTGTASRAQTAQMLMNFLYQ